MTRIPLPFLLLLLLALPACGHQHPAPAPDGVPPGMQYVASSRGQVYFWVGCPAWRSLSPSNLVWFETAEAALEAGLRPSSRPECTGPGGDMAANRSPSGGEEVGPERSLRCTVARVVDGDTLVCRERRERVRFLLVDAPELAQGEEGRLAKEFVEELAPPGTVLRLELDVRPRDRYRRLLAYLYLPDGRMLNEELARAGFAVVAVHPPNVQHVERLRAAVARAREERSGLWSRPSAFECTPADHRAGRCDEEPSE
jgi:micrococcal nuclease